jgi:hypothetical protein
MWTTIEGTYQDGKITLAETPVELPEGRVLVTFLNGMVPKAEHRQMVFGQFAGSDLPTEEDFRIAEWHGEEEFDEVDGS